MPSTNKKIKNATQTTIGELVFKSKLEAVVYKTLTENGFAPKYESTKYIIWEGGKPTVPFFNKDAKTGLLKRDTKVLLPITYTPDFEFEYDGILFIIEVKGLENEVFPIKKKLFRKYLETLTQPVVYFEIYSKRQLLEAIEIIKAMNKITLIRQFFVHLPEKDQRFANDFLDKRKFVELKEIVDANVVKLDKKKSAMWKKETDAALAANPELNLSDFIPSEEYMELESTYDDLIQLQTIVDEQALPFLEEEFYDQSLVETPDFEYDE